jgi:hypothetical protein|eukprot:SAG25_NODE_1043_length_4188_cov_5.770604_4_plen_122_part_00
MGSTLHLLVGALNLLLVNADTAIQLDGATAYISVDGVAGRLPSPQFTLSTWVYPTPGLTSGLGTVFAMNTATGDNVMSLGLDRANNVYEYKVAARSAAPWYSSLKLAALPARIQASTVASA